MSNIITVGIVCDDYKLVRYTGSLHSKGFDDYKTLTGPSPNTTLIKVKCIEKDKTLIATLCRENEKHFKSQK